MQDVTLDEENSAVSATVTHFKKYMVVWYDTWQHKIVYDSEIEDIQTVLAIDCSGSMRSNEPEFYYSDGNSIHTEHMTYRRMVADNYIKVGCRYSQKNKEIYNRSAWILFHCRYGK